MKRIFAIYSFVYVNKINKSILFYNTETGEYIITDKLASNMTSKLSTNTTSYYLTTNDHFSDVYTHDILERMKNKYFGEFISLKNTNEIPLLFSPSIYIEDDAIPTLILEEIDNKIYSILKKYVENAINPYIYPYIKYRITFPTPIYIYYTYHTYINKNNHLYSRHHLSLLDLIKTNNLSTHISDSNNIGLSGLSGIVLKQIITPYNIPTMKDPTGRNNKLLVNLNTLTL